MSLTRDSLNTEHGDKRLEQKLQRDMKRDFDVHFIFFSPLSLRFLR
jgi:hypothetical protein